jgi:AcrR family transcriptional regulator
MRRIIIKAAEEAFSKQPYDEINMDEIAEKALLSRATLYNYFDNKETLYFEVGLEGWVLMQELVPPIMEFEPTGMDKIMKLVPLGFHGVLESPLNFLILRRFMEKNNEAEHPIEDVYNAMTKEQLDSLDHTGDTVMLRYFHELQKYVKIWSDAIQIGQEDGSIRSDVEVPHLNQITFMYISGMLEQIVLQREALRNVQLPVDTAILLLSDSLRRILQP